MGGGEGDGKLRETKESAKRSEAANNCTIIISYRLNRQRLYEEEERRDARFFFFFVNKSLSRPRNFFPRAKKFSKGRKGED